MRLCNDCGYYHNTAADRVACAAIQGRVRAYPDDVRDPEAMCALCHLVAPFSSLLEHFRYHHRGERPTSGVLVRPIRTEGGL